MLSDSRTPKAGERSEASHIEILRSAQNDSPHIPCGAPLDYFSARLLWRSFVEVEQPCVRGSGGAKGRRPQSRRTRSKDEV